MKVTRRKVTRLAGRAFELLEKYPKSSAGIEIRLNRYSPDKKIEVDCWVYNYDNKKGSSCSDPFDKEEIVKGE